jgi:hypothetical protein
MRRHRAVCVGAAVLMLWPLLAALEPNAAAQPSGGPRGADFPSMANPADAVWLDDATREILLSEGVVLLVGVLGCGLLVLGVEAMDSWSDRRAGEVAALRDRIASALRRDRLLKRLVITPVVRFPLWGRSAATVELRGHVPTQGLRAAVRWIAEREAAEHLADCHIDDRLVVVSSRWADAA